MFIKSTLFFHSVSQLFLIASHWFCFFFRPPVEKIPYFQGFSLFLYGILVLKAFEHSFQEGWKRGHYRRKDLPEESKKKRESREFYWSPTEIQFITKAPYRRSLWSFIIYQMQCNILFPGQGTIYKVYLYNIFI